MPNPYNTPGYPGTWSPNQPGYMNWPPVSNAPASYNVGQQFQQPMNNLLRVTGPESAKAYPLPAKSSVVMFDADNPIFYLVSTDDSGFKTIRIFDFSERTPQEPTTQQDTSVFATKEELSVLVKELGDIKDTLKELI